MKKITFTTALFVFCTATLLAQYTNVVVGNGSEVSIMMDPNNTDKLVAGANITAVFNSSDGGVSWNQNTLTSSHGVNGDPAIIVDNAGNFYYFHLISSLDKIVCQKSTDGGATWSDGTTPINTTATDQDKEWAVYDDVNDKIYCTWASLDAYSSSNVLDSARIFISSSSDGAATWSTPVRLSKTAGNCGWNSIKGAVPAVGPNGEVYVAWCGNGISFQKSTDGGSTWLPQDVDVDFHPSWYFTIPGMTWGTAFPSIACDLSGTSSNGNLYISWCDTRNGANNTDVFLARSTDGGTTWNTIQINDDFTTNHNFHPWVTIDQTNGNVYVVFFDRRNYTNDNGTDTYLAYSVDGGNTFVNEKISQTSFTGTPWDYNNCVAHNGIIRPIWAQQSVVYTALIDHNDLPVGYDEKALPQQATLVQAFPNPTYNRSNLTFSVPEKGTVTLKIYDSVGKEAATIFTDKAVDKGYHEELLDLQKLGLSGGLYHCVLTGSSGNRTSVSLLYNR